MKRRQKDNFSPGFDGEKHIRETGNCDMMFLRNRKETETMMKKLTALCLLLALLLSLTACCTADEVTVPDVQVGTYSIPENDALKFVRDMKLGWNLGNTFDAIDCNWLKNPLDYESGWVGVKTSEALIQTLKDAGFKTLRLPVSWHNHVDADYQIDAAWLDRVYEVASWAYDLDMYVILNIHHDEAQFLPSPGHYEESARYIEAIWTQLAEKFRDFDSRLIMESMNEPRLLNSNYEWNFVSAASECRNAAKCLNQLNQLFVDTVRKSGGNNADRYLMVPAYAANPDYACNTQHFLLPEDTADNRIIVSVHAYTPYSFALQLPGVKTFDIAKQGRDIDVFMDRLYRTYVSRGTPVVIGEFGALNKNGNMQDRVDFTAYYVASARARGMTAVWWDNHNFTGSGEQFGLIDRRSCEWKAPKILEAMLKYCGE